MTLARAEFIAASLSETRVYVGQINQHLFVYLGGVGAIYLYLYLLLLYLSLSSLATASLRLPASISSH